MNDCENFRPEEASEIRRWSDRAASNAIRVFAVFSGLPRKYLSLRGGRRDLNPQQPEPQSGALPLSYDHHANGEKESSASSGSAKHIFRGLVRAWRFDVFDPVSVQLEFIATRVPINYRRWLIFNRKQILESPSLVGLVEAKCGRAR
jgi:hypothetical protein